MTHRRGQPTLPSYAGAMDDLGTLYVRQNEWANLRLIEACRRLTDEQLDTPVPGVYGSIRETFHHIVGAEGGYATQLGTEPQDRLRSGDEWPGWDALVRLVRETADALVDAMAGDLAAWHLVDQGRWEVEANVIAIQVAHHGADHRSQICTMLTAMGFEPPDLSAWDWGADTDRMRPATDASR